MLGRYTREFKYNIRLATPVIFGMLGHTLVALIDNIMVGQLGSAELAAVSLGNSFMFIAMSLGIGFSTAITPLVAEADAAEDREGGKSVFKHGLVLCSVLAIFLLGVLLLAKPIMYSMKQPIEVVDLAMPYLDLIAISLVPLIIFQALKQFSDGLSMTRYPMYATFLANGVNVLLNYMFIFGKFGAPAWGVIGAGVGTLASRVVMVIYLYILLRRDNKSSSYVTDLKLFNLQKAKVKKLLNLGIPSGMQMFFEMGIFTASVWLSGALGKNAQAANQIALNLSSMTFMVASGFGVAAMIRVGNQVGLKNYKELRRIAQSMFLLTLISAFIFAAVFMLGNKVFPKLYLDLDDLSQLKDTMEVVAIASSLLFISAIFQISDTVQVVALGVLRGMQDVKVPTIITFISYWLIAFPISYYLSVHTHLASMGIWIGLLTGLTFSGTLLYLRFNKMTKRLIRENENEMVK